MDTSKLEQRREELVGPSSSDPRVSQGLAVFAVAARLVPAPLYVATPVGYSTHANA